MPVGFFESISRKANALYSERTKSWREEQEEEERKRREALAAMRRMQETARRALPIELPTERQGMPTPFGRGSGGGVGGQFRRVPGAISGVGRSVGNRLSDVNLQMIPDQALTPAQQREKREVSKRNRAGTYEGLKTAVSGERVLEHLGVDTSGLPAPARYAIDAAAAPINVVGAGLASRGAILGYRAGRIGGRALAGQLTRRAGSEVAADIAARKGGEEAMRRLPEDTNKWVKLGVGLGAGAVAGGTAYGAAWKGTDPKVLKAVHEGELGQVTLPGGRKASPEYEEAGEAIVRAIRKEKELTDSGVAGYEKHVGRVKQASGIRRGAREGLAKGGTGEVEARAGAAVGQLRQTVAELELTSAQKDAVVREWSTLLVDGDMKEFQYISNLEALNGLTQGHSVGPKTLERIGVLFGQEVADVVAKRPKTSRQIMAQIKKEQKKIQSDYKKSQIEYEALLKSDAKTKIKDAKALAKSHKKLLDAQNEAGRQAEKARSRMMGEKDFGLNRKDFADEEALFRKRTEVQVNKTITDPETKVAVNERLRQWHNNNRVILDAIGETKHEIFSKAEASFTGRTQDSYVTALLERESFLIKAFITAGWDPTIARKVVTQAVKAEKAIRYGDLDSIPEWVQKAMESAKYSGSQGAKAASGIRTAVQVMKNSQFGIGDFAVVGVQAPKGVMTNAPNLLAGFYYHTINRFLTAAHLPHVEIPEGLIGDEVNYVMDGLAPRGSRGLGLTDVSEVGTILGVLPGPGRWLDDKVAVPFARLLNNIQFEQILGRLRNKAYEGGLVTAHLLGEDITDPLVRAAVAKKANSGFSFSHGSMKRTRADVEAVALLSPSMTRAQVDEISQVAKVIRKSSTRAERIMGSLTVISSVGSLLAMGKLLNDWVGTEAFEYDPSKTRFGQIRLANGTRVSVIPQMQIAKYTARAARVLMTEGTPEAAEEMAKLGLGRSSPVVQAFLRSMDVAFEPGEGVKFGDYAEGRGRMFKVLSAAPLPPIYWAFAEGEGTVSKAFSGLGFSAFDESGWDKFNRKVEKKYNKTYQELPEWQQEEAVAEFGKPAAWSREAREKADDLTNLKGVHAEQQEADDESLEKEDITPNEWRDNRDRRRDEQHGAAAILYGSDEFQNDDPTPLDEYWDIVEKAMKPNGETDWAVVDSTTATQSTVWQEYVNEYFDKRTLKGSDKEIEYQKDVDSIVTSGFWDIEEGKADYLRANPDLRATLEKWGYSERLLDYLDTEDDIRGFQQGLDAKYNIGDPTWVTETKKKRDKLAAAGAALFRDMEDKPPTNTVERWFQKIEEFKDQTTDEVQWDEVERWVAGLPEWEQKEIDDYEPSYLTDRVRAWKEDLRTIQDSGYWDIGDKYAKRFADRFGLDPETATWGSLKRRVEQDTIDKYLARGYSFERADLLKDRVVDRRLKRVNDLVYRERKRIRTRDRELGLLLARWNYWDPGQADSRILARIAS